ncbi:hypothetical protein PYW08_011105 [Mythimna loreyi]|uniref:Uncharacterized protein n=1 Tax=Mythimna loreyi TaxID=667449 RepID=A0ACC2Q2K7_9NEOP|nr:hypothetical protein PYW08_011105 [Mythimna loreyi]
MEGDGEGLVAIVQGLENSGVTLTVCNRSRHNSDTSRPSGLNRIQINAANPRSDMPAVDQRRNMVPAVTGPPAASTAAVQRTSVETSTGSDFSRMATASQICDGRYASSYKLAHCMISPTSPPEAVTEFPPQRKEPCRNHGNFEIGGHSSGQWNGHAIGHNVSAQGCSPVRVQTSRVRHYGGTQTWAEKGSSHRYTKANHRETEAFAHSLRKYPSMAPFRTASTDLIEKLIRYTQAKNYQEASRSTKSLRSLRNQRSSEHDSNRVSTQQQTYTRRRDEDSNLQAGSRGRTRHFKLYSPISDNRHLRESRCRETTYSSSYDYLKAGSPAQGRANRSDGSPSPSRSRSPEKYRSSERSCSPPRTRSPDRSVSPSGSGVIRVERPSRTGRPLRFERSVRDLSLSEMSKYIRSTIRQICNERPVVVQVCPKLKDRYNQHRKVCPNKTESSRDVMEFEEEEDPDQASSSVLSRFVQSLSGRRTPSTEQTGCQCSRTDCYCSKGTQCVNNPTATTNTATCSCLTTNTGCCRGLPCVCASKAQDQAYYNKRIDEEISEWLKNVPIQSIEKSESKLKRETLVKELRNTLKQLPDDDNFDRNATNEIQDFVEDFPLWNPGKDERDEKLFKNQLTDILAEKIKAIPRRPDRLRDIVRKWVENMDFEDNGDEEDMEAIIDNFVNRLKLLAADRPACDVKYTNILKKDIIELLVELALKFDGDMAKLKRMANNLAIEVASIPRNVNVSGETTKLASAFEENIADWICEHGLCEELQRNPKLIESLTRRLHILKAQGVLDEDIREEVNQFVDDVGLAFETTDELIQQLMKQISNSIQMKEAEGGWLDPEELNDEISDWLHSLPGASGLDLTKFREITEDLVKTIQENKENENLANDLVHYLANTDLSIDPADLGVYVEELMQNLGIQLSDRYRKEQAKRVMIKDIFDIIKCSPIPEEKKEQMRSRAHEIVETNLRKQSINLRFPSDSVKETLLQSMDDIVSNIDLPTKSRLQLKSLLNASISKNFDKSFTNLIRRRSKSDLKQSIISDVRNAIEELSIGQDKKNELMQKVKETLSKNTKKPLPYNIKNNINDEICDAVERCPNCEDKNVLSLIKKILSEVASTHLTIYLPNCVCDIQSEVEEDVCTVIDKSSIDFSKKRDLKESIQEILSENEDRRISDEVIRTIKKDIDNAVSDLSIPQEKKDILKKAVSETVSQDFHDAGEAFSHDLNKIRNKLLDDITSVIDKSPIQGDVKSHLKDKLDTVLARNLDSSISDEKAQAILDDISDIVRDVMPEEKRRSLTKKLAQKLGTPQRKEETDELTEIIDRLSIDSSVKDDMKKEMKTMLMKTLYNPLSVDVRQQISEDLLNAIDEIDIQERDKNKLKSNVRQNVTKELDKLITQNKEVPEIKDTIEKIIKKEIKNTSIPKDKQEVLIKKMKDVLTENLNQPVTDEVKEIIKERLENIVDDLVTDEDKADAIKMQLRKVDSEDLIKSTQTRPRVQDKESLKKKKKDLVKETLDNILPDIEEVVDDASIPREKKIELKNKLKNIAIKNFKKPLDEVEDGLKDDINEILDELNLPNDKKNKLNRELTAAVDKNMNDLQEGIKYIDNEYSDKQRIKGKDLKPIGKHDETKVKDKIFRGIDKIIDESGVPEEDKTELKRQFKKIATENLKNPFSKDVQDTTKNEITEIINDLPISKTEKTKLKSALTNIVHDNVANLRGPKITKVDDTPLQEIFQDTERAIEEAPIPREKKAELKKKLKKLTTKDFNEIPLKNIPEELTDEVIEIIDELNLPKDERNELKSALTTAADEYMSNKQKAAKNKYSESPDQPLQDIFQDTERAIEKAPIPREKKAELKKKLKKLTTKDFNEIPLKKIPEELTDEVIEIIDELNLPKYERNELKSAITTAADEYISNKQKTAKNKYLESPDQPLQDIFQDTERAIEEAPIPREKKAELKKKLKKLTTKVFNEIPLENVPKELTDNMIEIIDELNLPREKKNKLKSALITATDEYISNMQETAKNKYSESPDQPLKYIFQETERAIEEAPISRDKKTELKKKLKKLTTKDFKEIPLENVSEELVDDMLEIINELNLPREKKNKLKNALSTATDEYIGNMQNAERSKYAKHSDQKRRPSLKPTKVVDASKVKNNVLQGIEKIIEDSTVPKEKKMELKRKIKNVVAENLKEPLNEDVQDSTKNAITEIIKDLPIPNSEKNKLKTALINMVDDNMDDLRGATQKFTTQDKKVKKVDDKPLRDVFEDTERAIDEAPIPRDKKTELKKKLKKLTAKDFNKISLENVPEEIINDMIEIIDELNLPRGKKNELKSAVTTATDEYVSNKQKAARNKYPESPDQPLQDIFQDTERAIEEAPISRDKKTELKKKLKKLTTKDFNEIPLENVSEEIIDDMIEIIDELNLPRGKKNELKSALTTATDEYVSNMQNAERYKNTEYSDKKGRPSVDSRYKKQYADLKPVEIVDAGKLKNTILQGIEKITEDSNVPNEEKMELKRKLRAVASENLKKPFSEDVEDKIKTGIDKVIDDLPIPRTERKKLKNELTSMVDDNVNNLRGATQKFATQEDKFIKVDDKPLHNIFQETERAIEEAPLPREKKNELKKKLKKLTTKDYNKIPLEDVVEPPTDDIIEIIDELNLPKDKKTKLKSAVTNAVDEYTSNMQKARKKHTEYSNQKGRPSADRRIEVVEAAKVKDNILQGIEEIIEHSNVPKDKKMELKKKLKSVASENLKKPFFKDVDDKIKIGMEKIIDELPMPRTERNKLKNALTNMVEDHVDNLRGAETQKFTTQQDKFIKVDDKPLQDIFQKTEGAIEEAPVPTEKKNELKKKLKKLTIKDYKKIPLEDEAEPPTDEMIEIINELNLPKDKKTKLQSAVTNATNEYKSNIKTATRDKCTKYIDEKGRPKSIDEAYAVKVKDTILQGIEEITEDSNIPKEKKMELTRKLKNIVNENLKKPFSENVDEKIKIGVDKIIDDLPIPKTERNKLKSALTNMVDENIDNLRGATQITSQEDKLLKVDDKPLHDVFQEMERAIEEAPLPREKKNELKKKLKKLTTKDYNKIPLEDFVEPPKDDIIEILDELNLPKDKKTKLKSAVTNATDEYINNMRTKARDKYTANLDEPLRDYFKETERAIEEAPLPREKKTELKQKLKKVTTKDYNKISMEEVAKPLTDEMIEIIDEMNLPKDKKNKLKSGLTTATDEYMNNVQRATKVKDTEAPDQPLREIFREIERAIEESPLPREKKNELKQKLKKMTNKDYSKIPLEDVAKPPTDDIVEIIDELNLPKDKKNNLKSAVTTAADEYMSNVRTAAKDKYNEYPDQPLHEAFQGIERAIEESPLPREKKNEMKKKLKKLTNKDYNKIPLEEVAKPPIDDMTEIIDDLNLPKDKTNNLKSALNAATDKYMSNVRTAAKEKYKKYPDQPLHEYFQEIERTIEDSSLPREKKNELKKKLKKLTTKDFNTIPLEETPIGDMTEIIDEMNLPKDKRNKLINALNTAVDEYKSNMQTDQRRRSSVKTKYKKTDKDLKPIEKVDVAEVKNNIFQGIEKITEDSNIPREKKIELKRKLKSIAAENLKKPFSKDMQDTIKNDIAEIINELPISKTEKNQLNNALTNMLDENIYHLNEVEEKPLHNVFKYMERAIGEAPVTKEKKNALKKKLQDLATKDYNDISVEDLAEALKDGMIDIINELNLPNDKKNILKNDVANMIKENTFILQSESGEEPSDVDGIQRNIVQGFEEVIDEAPIPRDIRTELKKDLKEIANKNFNKPWSDDVADALKDHINTIIEDTNLPKDKKNNLKNELIAVVNENMGQTKPTKLSRYQKKLAQSSGPRFVIDERDVKGSMKKEVKKTVQKSDIGDADKSQLNLQLLRMISGMLAEFDEDLDERLKQIFEKYGIDPSYQNTLLEEYNKLLEIILKGGDIEDARRKLIEKLMRDLGLSEEVATALVDELIALAREIAQQEGIDDILKSHESLIRASKKSVKAFDEIDKIQQPSRAPDYTEQRTSEGRRRNPASSDIKGSTAFSTGNINYSLKELIATNKSVRKQWSKHLDDAITKLPLLRKENNDLKDKLAIYDETGQINILSSLSTPKEESNINAPANKLVAPKSALKNNKAKLPPRLSKIEEAFTFSNTTKQKSPFTPRSSKDAGVKDFTSKLKETISTWLNNAQVEIEPNDKNRILEELTKDIIDRQKYLQTFGEKTSQSDNLEYLKLQVHRRLNGLVPIDTLKSIIENTKELVVSVEGVKVPQLVVSPPATKSKKDQPSSKTKNDQTPSKTKINQQKRNTNSQKPSSPTQRKLGPADILGIHSKATNTTSADGVPHTVDDDDGVEDDSDTEFRPGQASTPAKPVDFLDKVTDAVTTWLESMPIDIDPDLRMDVINDLITDIVDRQKYLQVNPDKKFSEEDEIENLRFQVFKRLDKVFESDSSIPPDLVKVEELYKMINGDGQKKTLTAKQAQEFQTALNLEISSILNDYQICCDKRDLLPKLVNELMKLRNSGIDQDEIVENLVDTINRITYLRGDPAEELAYKLLYRTKKLIATIRGDVPVKKRDFKDAVMNDVGDVFQGSSMSESKRRMMENQLAEGYAKDLGIPLEDSYGTMTGQDSESKKDSYGMSFNGLSNYIDTWLSSIPDDETKDEDEIMDMKKQRMYCLMHKIGEMNVDPEIFNDDSLYEAVLREEIQHLFGNVSANDEEFKALKEDLIEKVLEAQRRAHDELAGQNYKNNLRDTISKLLPDQRNLSKEDKATMETLKDQLADAYIDLHYSGDNEYQRDKLKRKISNEINTFCRDYLNRNPCSPLNSQKLNRDLYAALSKVPLPPGDSIRYEVEQARIREEINDWVKELPLQPQNPTELLARNKLIYVLSKKLFDIEVDEQEEDPDNDMMRKKIVTFLNKLPLESDEDNETIADRLIDKLKSSEESRKYNASSNVTIDASGKVSAANSDSGMSPICPGYKPLLDRRKPCVFPKLCKRAPPKQSEAFPPCTLSPEDRDHLDRIRRRTCLSPNCVTSLMRKNKCPFGLGSPATNMGSQTVLKPFSIEDQQQNRICPFSNRPCPRASANLPHQPCPPVRTEAFQTEKTQPSTLCPAAFEKMPRTCPAGPMRSSQPCQGRRPTLSSSNVSDCTEEVQPQIVIKQYYWDPLNKNSIDLSTEEAQQTGRCNRRSDSITGHSPPRATPCTSPRPTSCRPPPCPPPRPAPCTTSRPPPCKPPPCYSSRPPTCHSSLPCETRTTCPQPAPGPCRRPSSGKQPTACSRPKSPRQNSSERYSFFDPLNSFQRSSHIINSRSPCTPSPCMSPFGINQCPPPGSLGFSKRFNECRMPKRDGLQEQVPSDTSRPSQKERVIELGSLDDVGSRPKKRHSDQSDWPKFHEDDNFWAAPMRRVILDEGIDESLVMERERREERVTCKCKERLVPKCSRPPPGTIPNPPGSQSSEEGQNLKRCSKCCGIHCPYPSFLYFRQ